MCGCWVETRGIYFFCGLGFVGKERKKNAPVVVVVVVGGVCGWWSVVGFSQFRGSAPPLVDRGVVGGRGGGLVGGF